jgi:hypothetical protein
MEHQDEIPYRIEVTLGGDSDISPIEEEYDWEDGGECEFILKSGQGDEKVFYGDLEVCIEAMKHLEELGLVPEAL